MFQVDSLLRGVDGYWGCSCEKSQVIVWLEERKSYAKKAVEQTLSKYKTNGIKFKFVLEDEDLVQIQCGGKILASRIGTLGCFVLHSQRESPFKKRLCLLTARHVLESQYIYYTVKDSPENIRGKGLYFRDMDLSIQKILKPMYNKCIVDFRDSSGDPCYVSLFPYAEKLDTLEGTSVYMRGAETKLSKGKICHRERWIEGHRYIIVESRPPNTNFAVPGDSGAVVCIEDKSSTDKIEEKKLNRVSVLGILKGRFKEKVTQCTSNNFKYKVMPMDDGLKYLKTVHDADITLCTVDAFNELKSSLGESKLVNKKVIFFALVYRV